MNDLPPNAESDLLLCVNSWCEQPYEHLGECDPQSAENGEGRTLYAVILAGLIEWAGPSADLEDCRSAARHITPAVRAHVTRHIPPDRGQPR